MDELSNRPFTWEDVTLDLARAIAIQHLAKRFTSLCKRLSKGQASTKERRRLSPVVAFQVACLLLFLTYRNSF
jgi:hypothetical protein